MDIEVGDELIRLKRNDLPSAMNEGRKVTVREILSEGRIKILEQSGVWHLEYFKKINKIYELWI